MPSPGRRVVLQATDNAVQPAVSGGIFFGGVANSPDMDYPASPPSQRPIDSLLLSANWVTGPGRVGWGPFPIGWEENQ